MSQPENEFRQWVEDYLFPRVHPNAYSKRMEEKVSELTEKLVNVALRAPTKENEEGMSETITWNSAHGFDCSACGHSQHPCEHWKIFVATAPKGQRCCEQGNFGELHDCAKGQSAETVRQVFATEVGLVSADVATTTGRQPAASTASNRQAFEEWWRSEGCTHLPAASEPPQHAYVAQKAWQARGVSEYEPGPTEMYLCEINHLILHSDQPYIFRKHPDCYGCNKYLAHGTPAEHNPARAPHNKFSSLWCDACPRPASGTPAPATTPNCLCGHSQSNHVSVPAHPGQLAGCQDCNCPQFAQAAAPGGKGPTIHMPMNSGPAPTVVNRNQDYLTDLRHDLQDDEYAFLYLSACAMEGGDTLRLGLRDVKEAWLASHPLQDKPPAALEESK